MRDTTPDVRPMLATDLDDDPPLVLGGQGRTGDELVETTDAIHRAIRFVTSIATICTFNEIFDLLLTWIGGV